MAHPLLSRIYYQYQADRLSACPITIHALLHIADSILFLGPVWVYWAFAMERFCGRLQRYVASRLHPYATLDRRVLELAQLHAVTANFSLQRHISKAYQLKQTEEKGFRLPDCKSLVSIPEYK